MAHIALSNNMAMGYNYGDNITCIGYTEQCLVWLRISLRMGREGVLIIGLYVTIQTLNKECTNVPLLNFVASVVCAELYSLLEIKVAEWICSDPSMR